MIIEEQKLSIFFGSSDTSPFTVEEFRSHVEKQRELLEKKIANQFENLKKNLSFKNIAFVRQIHGIDGIIVNSHNFIDQKNIKIIEDGDFLITHTKKLAVGILTADCLPIVFHDEINNIAAIAHAGWKGSVKNIAINVLKKMIENCGSVPENIKIILGPSAKNCCYEVDEFFYKNLDPELMQQTIKKTNKIFFDLPLYNKLLLERHGIKNISIEHNLCTICNLNFCSFRRNKEKSDLQMSIIMLK